MQIGVNAHGPRSERSAGPTGVRSLRSHVDDTRERTSGEAGEQGVTRTTRVMTWNIRGGAGNDEADPSLDRIRHLDRIAEVIREARADIVGLQEVDRYWSRSGGVDQARMLAETLAMETAFAPNWLPEGGTVAGNAPQYGVALLSRWPLRAMRHTLFGTPDGWEPRGVLTATVELPGGATLRVANTHLQVDPPDQDGVTRAQRLDGIAVMLRDIGTLEEPALLMGDFNAEPGSPELIGLEADGSGWRDCWRTVRGSDPGYTIPALVDAPPSRRIDYLFVTDATRVAHAEVVMDHRTRVASDHYPVLADLRFDQRQ
jgi:endonuclease/exonuclease/phosphatase family metal-dependent hydrolase